MKKINWCAIGDSFTYLNDHLDETGNRLRKGYLTRVCERFPNLICINKGVNGSTTQDWLKEEIPEADLYTILLGTNDWKQGRPLGNQRDYELRRTGSILGNIGDLVGRIRNVRPDASIFIMNPVERADFVYINDPHNNFHGSYAPNEGQWLRDIAKGIFENCKGENIFTLDLYNQSGFDQNNLIKYKKIHLDGGYKLLPYPEYIGLLYNPDLDEYPYPTEAIASTYDGLHPSDKGSDRIASILADCIEQYLRS